MKGMKIVIHVDVQTLTLFFLILDAFFDNLITPLVETLCHARIRKTK
jgi:hypothetical protein